VGVSPTVSLLYEFDPKNRLGLVYVAESSTELKGKLKFYRLGPNLDTILTTTHIKGNNLKVDSIMPQRVQFGLYHEWSSGSYLTFDAMWMDFSEFETGDVSLEGYQTIHPKGIYNDLWLLSLGYGIPVSSTMTYKLGLMHLTSGVDNKDRTLNIRLDEIWGIGAGFSRQLKNSMIDVNLNLINTGKAKVDTGTSLIRGRVVGESKTPYALMLDIAYHW